MDFFKAKEIYRTRAGEEFRQPDLASSRQVAGCWRLRDHTGKSLAIVGPEGQVLTRGTMMTTTPIRGN